jgi:hypothetical protein
MQLCKLLQVEGEAVVRCAMPFSERVQNIDFAISSNENKARTDSSGQPPLKNTSVVNSTPV